MPNAKPGSLSPADKAATIAYILSANGFPAASKELRPDLQAQKGIRMDTFKAQ